MQRHATATNATASVNNNINNPSARRDEAHRALALLEDYYGRLKEPDDAQLRVAIEKVMHIFRSQLFQALLDIQEFYESTLMDESRSVHDRTADALSMADKYQQQISSNVPGGAGGGTMTGNGGPTTTTLPSSYSTMSALNNDDAKLPHGSSNGGTTAAAGAAAAFKPYISKTFSSNAAAAAAADKDNNNFDAVDADVDAVVDDACEDGDESTVVTMMQPPPPPTYFFNNNNNSKKTVDANNSSGSGGSDASKTSSSMVSKIRAILADQNSGRARAVSGGRSAEYELGDWQYLDIDLERSDAERRGLGFSISGGNDNPQFEGDTSIYITRIIAGGAAHADGRLRVGDALLQVNDDEVVDVPHQVAVDALKRADSCVRLFVRRRRAEPRRMTIELDKRQRGLGFSIAGGIGNEHIPGDVGIYITRIMQGGAAALDGRLAAGDRIVAVGGKLLENVTHEQAVEALKNSSDPVVLVVLKPAPLLGATFPILLAASAGYFSQKQQPQQVQQPAHHHKHHSVMPTTTATVAAAAAAVVPAPIPPLRSSIAPNTNGNNIVENCGGKIYIPPTTAEVLRGSGGTAAAATTAVSMPEQHVKSAATVQPAAVVGAAASAAGAGDHHSRQATDTTNAVFSNNSINDVTVINTAAVSSPPLNLNKMKRDVEQIVAHGNNFLASHHHQQHDIMPTTTTTTTNSNTVAVVPTPTTVPAAFQTAVPGETSSSSTAQRRPPPIRTVTVTKGAQGLGFNIVGGEDGEGIFVSYIMPGGAAEKSGGRVLRGDQILSCNGIDLSTSTHEQAATALKCAQKNVTLLLQQRPVEFGRFESKINAVREQWENQQQQPQQAQVQQQQQLQQQQQPTTTTTTTTTAAVPDEDAGGVRKVDAAAAGAGTTAIIATNAKPAVTRRLKRSFHVRALFDYDPCKDSNLPNRGLPFCFGDILHVTNATDDEWWQAKRVNISTTTTNQDLGIIPSRQTVIKREKARLKSVSFTTDLESHSQTFPNGSSAATARSNFIEMRAGGSGDAGWQSQGKKSISFSRKFGLAARATAANDGGSGKDAGDGNTTNNATTTPDSVAAAGTAGSGSDDQDSVVHLSTSTTPTVLHIKSYELVTLQAVHEPRPLVIFGFLKDRLNEELTTQFPERFAQCVPHTTRPKRENEVEGKDYYFVELREQMEHDIQQGLFIEAGQYNENLYGTSVKAVKEIAAQGKHCVLDVNGPALRRLRASGFAPMVIAIRPKSIENISELSKRMSQEQAVREYDRAHKLEDEYGHLFTAVVQGDSFDDLFEHVKDVIVRETSEPECWLPSNEKFSSLVQ